MNNKELLLNETKLSLKAAIICLACRTIAIGYSAYRGVISFQTFKEIWIRELPLYLVIYVATSIVYFVYRAIKLKLQKNKETNPDQ